MKKAGLFDQIDPIVWNINWNVNCWTIGSSEGSLKYLAPYVFKNVQSLRKGSMLYLLRDQGYRYAKNLN